MARDLTERQLQAALDALELELRADLDEAHEGLGPDPDDSESAKRRRRERAAKDPAWFRAHYFPHAFEAPLTDWHTRLWAFQAAHHVTLELIYRGWGKTTDGDVEEVRLQLTGQTRLVNVTARDDLETAQHVLRMRLEIEANPRLLQDFGHLAHGRRWTQNHYSLRNGAEVRGRSLKSSARGSLSLRFRRPDRWVLDDLQKEGDERSGPMVEGAVRFFTSVVLPSMRPGGVVRVRGTRLSESCVISRIGELEGVAVFELPAELPDGTLADPHRHPRAFLAQQRTAMGEVAYRREYLHQAEKPDALVRREWIQPYRVEQLQGLPLVGAVYWDPARRVGGDYRAIVSFALHPASGRVFCVRAFLSRRASPDEQAREFWRQWLGLAQRPQTAAVAGLEHNGMQSLFEYPVEQVREELGATPISLIGVTNTLNKESRVWSVVPQFERGTLHFDEEDSHQKLLVQQWLQWPDLGTDGPDATEGALRLLQTHVHREPAHGFPGAMASQPEAW